MADDSLKWLGDEIRSECGEGMLQRAQRIVWYEQDRIMGAQCLDSSDGDGTRITLTARMRAASTSAGTYTVHEAESAGYAQAEDQTVTVSAQNGADYPAVAGFENWKLHAVVTVSDRDTGLRISGIPLHIRDASGTELHFRENPDHSWDPADSGNPVSGSDGTAVLNGMPKGTWSVTVDAPEGYLPAEGTSLTVSGSSTQSAPAAAKVQLALSAARITKTDRDTAEPLEGVRFTLKKDGTGIPVVLLHGYGQSRTAARPAPPSR